MTCRSFSGSSDACSPEFSILGKSYLSIFLSCLKVLHKSYRSQDMIFCYTWLPPPHRWSQAPRAGGRIACVWDHLEKCAFSAKNFMIWSFLGSPHKDPKGAFDWPMRLLWRKNRFELAPDESLVQNIGNDRSLYAQEMTHAAIQYTNRFYPEKSYEGFDFDMVDTEIA